MGEDKPMTHEEFIETLEDVFRLSSNEGYEHSVNKLIPYLKEKYSIEINPNVTDLSFNFNFLRRRSEEITREKPQAELLGNSEQLRIMEMKNE